MIPPLIILTNLSKPNVPCGSYVYEARGMDFMLPPSSYKG